MLTACAMALVMAAAAPLIQVLPATANSPGVSTGPSGLPLPRFVSLKSDRVNVRAGPARDHRVVWTFVRAGLPVEITAEFENWRRIRDSEGAEGWVFHSLLSGRRTALVAPWSGEETIALRRSDSRSGAVAGLVEPGALADVRNCDGRWCRISFGPVTGWMPQDLLWGVYPDEVLR